MHTEEFSNEFDIIAASYDIGLQSDMASKGQRGLLTFNEYEKSLFLTKSMEAFITQMYEGSSGGPFEKNEKTRRVLEELVVQETLTPIDPSDFPQMLADKRYRHTVFSLPSDVWYIVFEQALWDSADDCASRVVADVLPVTHDEYLRIRENPFRGPMGKRALRLDNGSQSIELVSDREIGEYTIRYIAHPKPIITAGYLEGLTINGENRRSECILNPSVHRDILEYAVRLAVASRLKASNEK